MKFEQKLINLRKQKSMSQEELAEKLNVTRQTISKWELGQSKPDMDKLLEISKLFEVSVEELTNETVSVGKEKVVSKPKKQESKWILYVLIVVLIASLSTLVVRIGMAREEAKQNQNGFFNKIFGTVTGMIENQMNNQENLFDNMFETGTDIIENQMNNNSNINTNGNEITDGIKDMFEGLEQQFNNREEEKKESPAVFNAGLTYAEGTKATIFVENMLDKVVTKNKQNKDMLITVKYKNKSTTDVDEIKAIKKSLKQWSEYEVSVDYNDDGYITKITIED